MYGRLTIVANIILCKYNRRGNTSVACRLYVFVICGVQLVLNHLLLVNTYFFREPLLLQIKKKTFVPLFYDRLGRFNDTFFRHYRVVFLYLKPRVSIQNVFLAKSLINFILGRVILAVRVISIQSNSSSFVLILTR